MFGQGRWGANFGSPAAYYKKEAILMPKSTKSRTLYPHPFSKAYWRDAALELKDTRMLVFAALMIALRLVMKLIAIPLAPGLKINTAFLANALGAMVFGPVMAGLCAVVTDILGYLMNPEGVYFVPFVLTEVAGSMIFALFLYRTKVTPGRVMLSRFCICFFVNILLQTPIMMWYYSLFMSGKTYVLTIPGIVKNLFMFPIESIVLTLFLDIMIPITNRLGLTYGSTSVKETLRFSKKQIALLVVLFVVGSASAVGYLNYYYNTTSLSASYTSEERVSHNHEMQDILLAQADEFDDAATVTIVESAKQKFLGKEITYTAAVYYVDEGVENTDTLWTYSKSKAAKDETLTRAATMVAVVNKNTGEVVSFTLTPEDSQ